MSLRITACDKWHSMKSPKKKKLKPGDIYWLRKLQDIEPSVQKNLVIGDGCFDHPIILSVIDDGENAEAYIVSQCQLRPAPL